MVNNLQTQEQHLKPLLDQLKPDAWVSNGAPQTYVTQWRNTEAELKYLMQNSDAFMKQPEKLPLALDTYFRMQSINTMLGSITEAVRKYQNPAVAELVQSAANETAGNADKLREYIRELAQQKEEEFQVADREAQKCRASLLKQTPMERKSK